MSKNIKTTAKGGAKSPPVHGGTFVTKKDGGTRRVKPAAKTYQGPTRYKKKAPPIDLAALKAARDNLGDTLVGDVNVLLGGGDPDDTRVTLPSTELDALLARIEDLEDRLALAKAGGEESFPVDVLDRLLAGESPVRVFREYRGLKQNALAATCDITNSYLSRIEKGEKTPGVDIYRKLADALDLDIDDLV